jgi:protein involved in polysaccharide export with SLBB domain
MKRILLLALTAFAGLTLAAQTGSDTNSPAAKTASPNTSVVDTNRAPDSLIGYVADDKYKLRVGDRVSFEIVEDHDAPRTLPIGDSGEVDLPYLGRVSAIDKTCKQLADEVKTQLEKDYYYRATVVVALDAANRVLGRIYIWGQVHVQGPIEIAINEHLTVGTAILRAGGFGDFADKKKVKLIRGGGPAGSGKDTKTIVLNMAEVLEKGKVNKDVAVQPNDFIIVPSRLLNF